MLLDPYHNIPCVHRPSRVFRARGLASSDDFFGHCWSCRFCRDEPGWRSAGKGWVRPQL